MSFCGSVQTNTSSICQSKVWPFGLDGVHMDVFNLLFWFSLEMKNEIVMKGALYQKSVQVDLCFLQLGSGRIAIKIKRP